VTNPQWPAHEDPSIWARPGSRAAAAGQAPAQTDRLDTDPTVPDQPPAASVAQPYPQAYPAVSPTGQPPSEGTTIPVKSPGKTKRRLLGDPVSIVLVVVIVAALLGAGLVGAELYARHRADEVVAAATECVVHDKVSVSFGGTPFLLQHVTGNYRDISIHTAGNQIRGAQGMRADIAIDDVDMHGNADSKGTIGALDAAITWTSDGIKQTVADSIPLVGGFVDSVTTNPGAGTVELRGGLGLGSVTIKPQVAGNALSLRVVGVSALGATLPSETAQDALDAFTSRVAKDYPLGLRADSVHVTDDGVAARFSTRNASIPTAQTDPCFAKL
jgi:hypothetical protein